MTPDTTDDTTTLGGPVYVVTITKAAELLGVSVRTVQRRLDGGEWESTQVAGKRCVRLPADALPDGMTLDATDDIVDSETLNMSRDVSHDGQRDTGGQIVPLRSSVDIVPLLAAAIVEAQRATERPSVPIEAKLLLSLQEAQALTGLSRETLRKAIDDQTLKARQIGRKWRVRRSDLERYIEAG